MQVSPDLRAFVRIRAEFSEQPGVRLTSEQVQRLCGLDSSRCDRMLEALVQTRFLYRAASCYVRLIGYSPSP